jgi:uncharacterized protein YecE (DUF72 family)
MSGTVHANPERLRNFREQLTRELDDIERVLISVRRGFGDLRGAAWSDEQHEHFEQALEERLRTIVAAVDAVQQELLPYLDRQADKLEHYLRERP